MSSTAETILRPSTITAAQRTALRAEESIRRQARLNDTANEPGRVALGPLVLGLFMFCILCNCLFYFYHQTKVMLEPAYTAKMQEAITGNYTAYAASLKKTLSPAPRLSPHQLAQPVAFLPLEPLAWHKVANGDDVDYLRIALRISLSGHSPHSIQWRNPANGHHGLVTQLSNSQSDASAGCRRFHITRASSTDAAADNVDFCSDGLIREAAVY